MTDPFTEATSCAATVERLLDDAVAGAPWWRRANARRELRTYLEDALTDVLAEGVSPRTALERVRGTFGTPELVAEEFRGIPASLLERGVRRGVAPLGVGVLGVVLGLALVQMQTPRGGVPATAAIAVLPEGAGDSAALARRYVREVDRPPTTAVALTGASDYQVAARLGLTRSDTRTLDANVPALLPDWLPEGYNPEGGELFLTGSATVQYFPSATPDRPGIVIETLRPDRSTVFQVMERHVFPVGVGPFPGFYIDGEWEVRGPLDEQPAPGAWRTDRSHSLLFARDGLLVLVAGPADLLDIEGLLRIARSLR